jgi:dipeptidyl aminopeptidase/acylaminoacyl peptidase
VRSWHLNRGRVRLAVTDKVRFSVLIAFVVVLGACTEIGTPVTVDLSPRFSPDGTRLVFTSDRGDSRHLYEIDLTTGEIV